MCVIIMPRTASCATSSSTASMSLCRRARNASTLNEQLRNDTMIITINMVYKRLNKQTIMKAHKIKRTFIKEQKACESRFSWLESEYQYVTVKNLGDKVIALDANLFPLWFSSVGPCSYVLSQAHSLRQKICIITA